MLILFSHVYVTENNVNICIDKAWPAIDNLMTIVKFDLFDKIKLQVFQVEAMSVLLYGCITLM